MWKGLLAAGLVALWAGSAGAVTMTATFAGTVTSGLDQSGIFLNSGSKFSGQHFSLSFTYDPVSSPGAFLLRHKGSATGGYYGDQEYDSAYGSLWQGIYSPVLSAVLTIAGKTFAIAAESYSDRWRIGGGVDSVAYRDGDYASGPLNKGAEDSYFSASASDSVLTCVVPSYTPERFGCTPTLGVDYYQRTNSISASFFNPLMFADLEAAFRVNQSDTSLNWGGSFAFTDCAYDGDSVQSCSRNTNGSFSVASLTVGPSVVPLPASAWLLLGALGGLVGLRWRRKPHTAT